MSPPLPAALIRDEFANIPPPPPPHTHTVALPLLSPPSPSFPPRLPPSFPPRCEAALIQNEVTNIFQDDFSTLAEEDAGGGTRKESNIAE